MDVPPFLFIILISEICIVMLFYTRQKAFILLFYLFLFYILHKNKSADTIQTSNKYSIKLLNIHY
ncbi:hypothetical protein C6352_07930 [Bacillus thuringiensis]|nr:hypothetical protein C6352_07930 [Bacillus thuringiensis]